MMDEHRGGPGPQLPDFSAPGGGSGNPHLHGGSGDGDPHGEGGSTGATHGDAGSGGGRGPLLALLLGGGGCLVVILAVLALVLSQTVLRGDPEDPDAGTTPSATDPSATDDEESGPAPSDGGTSEGAADPVDQDPATEAEASGTACTEPPDRSVTEQETGSVRGGGLEIPQPEGWEVGTGWGAQNSYLTDQHYADQPVEGGWYALAGVGAVEFPEEEGGYPGAEEAARAIFLCALEPEQGEEIYGDPAMLRNHRDEATTIDGHDAWIVSADVEVSDLALLHSTDAWRRVVIVVDTPGGPAAFVGGAALGHDQQVADLDTMIEGLRVL